MPGDSCPQARGDKRPGLTHIRCGGIRFYPPGSGVCGAAWSALEPVPTSAQMCSAGKAWGALRSKAESLGNTGICVQAGSLPRERGGVLSQKLGWQRLQAVPALTELCWGDLGYFTVTSP